MTTATNNIKSISAEGHYAMKRVFDLTFGVVLFVVLLPVMMLIALLLMIRFRGNPLFTQERGLVLETGTFKIIKFRTMLDTGEVPADADAILQKSSQSSGIGQFCSLLRKTGLDELPQLINVIQGRMSFIGPRPLSVGDLRMIKRDYPAYYAMRSSLLLKPGISGLWQIFGERSGGVKNLAELDTLYGANISASLDMYLIIKTIPVMLFAGHSDAILGERNKDEFRNASSVLWKYISAGQGNPVVES